jgi:hypothetical protein
MSFPLSPGEPEETCPRCDLPRSQWSQDGLGFVRIDKRYCCRGCAEDAACTCLEAGAAA